MTLLFAVLFSVFLAFMLRVQHARAHKFSFMTWRELAGKLQPVQTEGIKTLALELLEPHGDQPRRDVEETWDLVGGAAGLSRMENNADILVALALYAQKWNRLEGVMVTERMRRDGIALRRAILGLGLGKTTGYGAERVPLYVQEAASSYYLMRKRLLLLLRE